MIYMAGRWKMAAILVLLLLLAELAWIGGSRAQIKKEDVDFEILATVTMKKGDTLWELAEEYYDDPLRWKYIMEMNKIRDEKRISIGTVIYIPVKDAKKIVEKVEEEIKEKKAVEEELTAEIKKLKSQVEDLKEQLAKAEAKNEQLASSLRECQEKNRKLTQALEEKEAMIEAKDATIKELQAMLEGVKASIEKIKEEAEIAAQAREMRAAAQTEKDELIEKLEAELRRRRREIDRLEEARDELTAKIERAEREERAPMPVRRREPVDQRSRVAAVAIALVGAIIWIASD